MLVAKTHSPVIPHPSPNHNARKTGIDMLVLHYTNMPDATSALARMCDPSAEASAHYLIGKDGRIFQMVDESRRAWHAGISCWLGESDINSRSIGIELDNSGNQPFPEVQMATLEELARNIIARHAISKGRVLGHSDVAPLRKQDPGKWFDWARLAKAGTGLWPEEETFTISVPDPAEEACRLLAAIGYGYVEESSETILLAFQQHFLPGHRSGKPDEKTIARLRQVLALIEKNR
ncbi:MAG TPA: N-acetylmuramoyl-L-alanine amidase [Rhodospirillaceae bacterium]|nr:MAG: hypothetical protein A2018_07975 [Alphaproteobacteria bacterium GWF2_58_20]HAU29992.1 N-acetylmuramoyl-L-alanine amidase [Rhodospirillaceae bacterium]